MNDTDIHDSTTPCNDDATPAPRKWKRRFERGTPEEALTWKTAKQRSDRMLEWRRAVMKSGVGNKARAMRVAWLLGQLCLKEGYAYAADSYLAAETGLQLNHVQAALADLGRAGAIVRASSYVDGKPLRRIWPSAKIMPPKLGGIDTPQIGTQDTPRFGGTDSRRETPTQKTRRISTTAEAAKLDAERRERRRSAPASASPDDTIVSPPTTTNLEPIAIPTNQTDPRRSAQARRREAPNDVIEGEIPPPGGRAGAAPPARFPNLERALPYVRRLLEEEGRIQ